MVVNGGGDETREVVGMIRGCIKTVTCGRKVCRKANYPPELRPVFTKLAYILGLRVSPSHRYIYRHIFYKRQNNTYLYKK